MSPKSPCFLYGPKMLARFARPFCNQACEHGSANTQRTFIMCRKNVCGKESRGKWSVGGTEGFEKFADEAQLLQLFARGADCVRGLHKAAHKAF